MGFLSTISGGDLTNLRGDYTGRAFLLATPETIVFQTELPSLSGSYADITYGTVLQGVYTDVKPDMVYTITASSTDFNNPTIRGYIRESAATATKIYIDQQDDTLASGFILTVFSDYDIFPRKPRYSLTDDQIFLDYDLAFQKLPPTISNLQSVYVTNTTGASASFAFAPTTTALSEGAAISSYLWEVGDGTITVGTTTTKDITVSFPAGHRWVTFSTTDDNGVTHRIHFEVFVGDLISASFTLHGAESFQWSNDFDGWNGSASMFADVGGITDNQRLTLCILDNNNGTARAINTNIALIGRYRREATKTDGGNETSRNTQDSDLQIEGFGQSLSNIPIPKFNIKDVDSPTVWNDIIDPSPVRSCWHVLTRYTTAGNLMSFDSLSADLVYKSGAIAIAAQGCLSGLNQVLERYNAQINFSSDGTVRVRRNTNFIADGDRSALATIADLQIQDISDYTITTEYNDTVGQVTGGGLWYDATAKNYQFFIAKAPTIISTIGEEILQFNGQILDSTDTPNDASTDLTERTAAKLAMERTTTTLTATMFDSWRLLEASNYDRYTITIPATLNLRNKAYTTSEFWQLKSISFTANVKEGTIQPRAIFEAETSGGTAGRVVAVVPPISDVGIPMNPVMQPYSGNFNVGAFLFNPEDFNFGDEWEVSPESYQNVDEPKDGNAHNPLPKPGQGIYKLYFSSNSTVTTTFNTVPGEQYKIEIGGDAYIESQDVTYQFLGGDGQGETVGSAAALANPPDTPHTGVGVYNSGLDLYDGVESVGQVCNIEWTLPTNKENDVYVKSVFASFRGDRTGALEVAGGADKNPAAFLDSTFIGGASFGTGGYTNQLRSFTVTEGVQWTADTVYTKLYLHGSMDQNAGKGAVRIDKLNVILRNTDKRRGDAFYRDYNVGSPQTYTAGNGLLINGSNPATAPLYNSSHAYTSLITGNGSPLTFKFGDSDYTDNETEPLIIRVTGSGAT